MTATETNHTHEPIVEPKPVYDMSVGAAYVNLCKCPVAVTLSRMSTTYNAVNIDYARTVDEGLHPVGVELLNLQNFSALKADLMRIGMERGEAEKVATSFVENPPTP